MGAALFVVLAACAYFLSPRRAVIAVLLGFLFQELAVAVKERLAPGAARSSAAR